MCMVLGALLSLVLNAKATRAVFNVADEPPMNHWAWAERFRAARVWTLGCSRPSLSGSWRSAPSR